MNISAQSVREAKDLFVSIKDPSDELLSQWNECCSDLENFPMLTKEKQNELKQALIDREKQGFWSTRDWCCKRRRNDRCTYSSSCFQGAELWH
eukprot:95924-Hanusia_phi.AAC.3